MSLLGVSENNVPINTRMVLEKGLRLFGSSRSGREDFEKTVELYREHPEVLDYLAALVMQRERGSSDLRHHCCVRGGHSQSPWARRLSSGTCSVLGDC